MSGFRFQSGHRGGTPGVTLVELLITLGLIGVIGAISMTSFASNSQQSGQVKLSGSAKEAVLAVSMAYTQLKLQHPNAPQVTWNPSATPNLTQYLNYRGVDTRSAGGAPSGETALESCSDDNICYKLANGTYLQVPKTMSVTPGSAPTASWFDVDPDGPGTQAGKVRFYLRWSGQITREPSLSPAWLASEEGW